MLSHRDDFDVRLDTRPKVTQLESDRAELNPGLSTPRPHTGHSSSSSSMSSISSVSPTAPSVVDCNKY